MGKLSAKDIKEILDKGTSVQLRADDYLYFELLDFAVCAISKSSKLTLTIGGNLTEDEILTLASVARRNLKLILS